LGPETYNNKFNNNMINLFVVPVHGRTTVVRASPDWSVARLNQEIVTQVTGGKATQACDQLRLLHGTHQMSSPEAKLSQVGLSNDDTVQCLLRLVGGKKTKSKGGKSHKKGARQEQKQELVFKEDGQMYAQVVSMLGSSRMKVVCDDGKERTCTIRGKLVRRAWVAPRDIVLVTLRDWERTDDKCDMIGKYSHEEARRLNMYKELPVNMTLIDKEEEATEGKEEDGGIEFTWSDDEDLDIDAI